jgi:hypothetical protein
MAELIEGLMPDIMQGIYEYKSLNIKELDYKSQRALNEIKSVTSNHSTDYKNNIRTRLNSALHNIENKDASDIRNSVHNAANGAVDQLLNKTNELILSKIKIIEDNEEIKRKARDEIDYYLKISRYVFLGITIISTIYIWYRLQGKYLPALDYGSNEPKLSEWIQFRIKSFFRWLVGKCGMREVISKAGIKTTMDPCIWKHEGGKYITTSLSWKWTVVGMKVISMAISLIMKYIRPYFKKVSRKADVLSKSAKETVGSKIKGGVQSAKETVGSKFKKMAFYS